jgi:hypothetical protein
MQTQSPQSKGTQSPQNKTPVTLRVLGEALASSAFVFQYRFTRPRPGRRLVSHHPKPSTSQTPRSCRCLFFFPHSNRNRRFDQSCSRPCGQRSGEIRFSTTNVNRRTLDKGTPQKAGHHAGRHATETPSPDLKSFLRRLCTHKTGRGVPRLLRNSISRWIRTDTTPPKDFVVWLEFCEISPRSGLKEGCAKDTGHALDVVGHSGETDLNACS